MTDTTEPHVYRVSEIRDGVLRRDHGYYASLGGAFAYCEAQERTPSTVATARFELFPVPGGEQWMIHTYYGPDDPYPEISDLVITRVMVIPDASSASPAAVEPPADQTTPSHRAALSDRIADAVQPLLMDTLPKAIAAAQAREITAAVLAVLPAPADRATVLRDAADAIDNSERLRDLTDDHMSDINEAANELRRMADETATETPEPHRGDAFEQWLKARRDEWAPEGCQPWQILDQTLEEYRLHADTGTPLGEHVCEARVVGDCECLEQPAAGARQDGSQP